MPSVSERLTVSTVYKYNYAEKETNWLVPLLDSARQRGLTASRKQKQKTNSVIGPRAVLETEGRFSQYGPTKAGE